jgi:HPt (histidine-containing phosphotransfer) domain-containing protein
MSPPVVAPTAPAALDERQPPCVVLDADALRRLHALDPRGENRVVERVLHAFESAAQRLLDQAAQARTQGDLEAMRHVAHTLKSSSASVGALALSQHCFDIENRLRLQHAQGLEPLLDELQREGARALDAVRRQLAGAGAR